MRWRSISTLSILSLLVVPAGLAAAIPRAPRPIRLGEAISLALRQNPSLASATAALRAAQAGVETARGLDDFVLDATVSGDASRREPVAGTPVQQPASDDLTASLGLSRPLATGGLIGLRLSAARSRATFATDVDAMMMTARPRIATYAPALQLVFRHPLLRGLGVRVARADRWRAQASVDLATAQRQGAAAALLRDLSNAYWDLSYAAAELEIRRAAAASARDQLARVRANVDVGKQSHSASAEVEVAIALRDETVLLAEQTLADRGLELARLCGLPVDMTVRPMLIAADAPGTPADVPERDRTLQRALDGNPQLQAVRAQGRAAAIEVEVTDNGLLPQLDLEIKGGPVGNARDRAGAVSQFTGLESYVVTAGLVFEQPLGRHAARGAASAARETWRKVALDEADISQQVAGAVARAMTALETARGRIEVLARSTEAASVDLEAERARFEVGRSTNFDVLRRQDSLASVKLAHLRARVDLLKALAMVEALTGDILMPHWRGEQTP